MADLVSLCVSSGKVTILAAWVSVPAWVRRQRQVRGFGTWVCWWWGLEEGWVGRGSLCPTGEGGKSIQMPGR